MTNSAGLTAAILAIALLCACEEGQQPENNLVSAGPQADYQTRLQALPETARNAVFIRALRDAGFDCQHVEASAFEGAANGAPTWSARCDDGNRWTIAIGPNGVAQVANAEPPAGAVGPESKKTS